ncbi:hypothetical protein [Nitrososphaera sp.]|uniref:hypothetical protein n=1 Tax=Nitrososphaera sp. TaxID=1971748 RepID=UPI002ED8EB01
MQVFEIHKYKGDELQYVVARTNKHSEDYVRNDAEKMNSLLTPEIKAEGIRYVFALGTVDSMTKKTSDKKSVKKETVQLAPSG